ncbi:hypothetical protein M427DRAFT_53729 [Gonapodya prolifera JEL478]|uniref:F-box domain-containing protein n=1 Tax=Gonapodya prolifera (strain JEL478) TaxID=1344416 RepID=A0A139ANL1_GONPJ|nr:hypothetical protein M427DRAFT_53729 [Gonapodya prolifera JEL478]|eukprot:KXS18329.1 hypothetical protein M427DRAFT_53729 [Gonapodya prolifera JEL478]
MFGRLFQFFQTGRKEPPPRYLPQEVLETILTQLPPCDAFGVAPSVCRSWKTAVQSVLFDTTGAIPVVLDIVAQRGRESAWITKVAFCPTFFHIFPPHITGLRVFMEVDFSRSSELLLGPRKERDSLLNALWVRWCFSKGSYTYLPRIRPVAVAQFRIGYGVQPTASGTTEVDVEIHAILQSFAANAGDAFQPRGVSLATRSSAWTHSNLAELRCSSVRELEVVVDYYWNFRDDPTIAQKLIALFPSPARLVANFWDFGPSNHLEGLATFCDGIRTLILRKDQWPSLMTLERDSNGEQRDTLFGGFIHSLLQRFPNIVELGTLPGGSPERLERELKIFEAGKSAPPRPLRQIQTLHIAMGWFGTWMNLQTLHDNIVFVRANITLDPLSAVLRNAFSDLNTIILEEWSFSTEMHVYQTGPNLSIVPRYEKEFLAQWAKFVDDVPTLRVQFVGDQWVRNQDVPCRTSPWSRNETVTKWPGYHTAFIRELQKLTKKRIDAAEGDTCMLKYWDPKVC